MNAIYRPPPAAPMIPENAPFSPEQRAWLNGFFAGLLAVDSQSGAALPARESAALAATLAPAAAAPGLEDDGAPWHDQTLPLGERMKLAGGRPLRRRMMAAMGQQDCGQCGYNCEDYANAIAAQAEERLNLCVPGAKETARILKTLVEEMGGGATDPDDAKAKADAKAAAPISVRGVRETPRPRRCLSRARGSTAKGLKRRPITWSSIFRTPASIINLATVSASTP
jgi:sulfite reductase (NADPH) flavoprotein alpha-component